MESLGLDWKLLIAQIVNFGLLYFVLKKVIFKPLIKAIDDRNKKIDDALKNSQEIELKLKKIDEQKKEILEKAKIDARKEREEFLDIALQEKEKIIKEAKLSAKREIDKGVASIELAKKEAVNNITEEYMEKLTDKLNKRLYEKSEKNDYPLLKSLLK